LKMGVRVRVRRGGGGEGIRLILRFAFRLLGIIGGALGWIFSVLGRCDTFLYGSVWWVAI
jgi:hypothetical protein